MTLGAGGADTVGATRTRTQLISACPVQGFVLTLVARHAGKAFSNVTSATTASP